VADMLRKEGSNEDMAAGDTDICGKECESYLQTTSSSPSLAPFLDNIMALLDSIAARVASSGPKLCRQILYMMHDNLWQCWFPKESLTETAGWKRQGIFDLQKAIFFGNNSVGGIEKIAADDNYASDLICELYTTILINVGYQQVGQFNIMIALINVDA
jgi:hypothetical protein